MTGASSLALPAGGTSQDDDSYALSKWLAFVALRNKNTHRSYQTEATRFRIFLETVHANDPGRPIQTLLRDASEMDVALYEAHLLGRLRTGEPVAALRVPPAILARYGRKDQPFILEPDAHGIYSCEPVRLLPSTVNQAISILHAMYQHWLRPDPQTRMAYVGANPVHRIKASTNRMTRQIDRNLPIEAIQAIFSALDTRERESRLHDDLDTTASIARQRWIVALLFGLWGRRQEVANLCMNDFRHDGIRWTVHLVRKGGKEQNVPVAQWVMQELARYRQSLGMTALPHPTDESPAIARLREREDHSGTVNADTIYRIVIAAAKAAANDIREGKIFPDLDDIERERIASKLDEASPHWFRHSGASIAINSGAMSLENASKLLAHSSTSITASMYYHEDESQIADGLEQIGRLTSPRG